MSSDINVPLIDGTIKQKVSARGKAVDILSESLYPERSDLKFKKISNYFEYLSFADILPLLKRLNFTQKSIVVDNLPAPDESFNAGQQAQLLDRAWQEERQKNSSSLTIPLLNIYKWRLTRDAILCICLSSSFILSSMLLGRVINLITRKSLGEDIKQEDLILYAVLYLAAMFVNTLFEYWYGCFSYGLGLNIKLGLIGLIYKKINMVALSSLMNLNLGKIINIISNNLNDLDWAILFMLPMVLAPLNVFFGCLLMWRYFGAYSILSILCQIIFMIFTTFLSKKSEKPRTEINTILDQRIKYTNELIENIRLIKLYAWEKPFRALVEKFRKEEEALRRHLAIIEGAGRAVSDASVLICVFAMLTVYVLQGGVLSPESVYITMLVLNFMKSWVILFFHYGRMALVGLRLTQTRIEEVLLVEEVVNKPKKSVRNEPNLTLEEEQFKIIFRNFTAYWSTEAQVPCLNNLSTKIPSKMTTMIVGKVGSGKTSLLLSILNEIPKTSGSLSSHGSIAYVEQEPIIFSETIRSNILFGRPYDKHFYKQVLRACNLEEDLNQFDCGDQTIVGERGVTLSGGQKARLSLARALYSESDIYLLDDPLSAVDARVGRVIFDRAIKQILKDKTVVLVTHHLSYAKDADKIIVMNNGAIEAEGTYDSLLRMNIDFINVFSKGDDHTDEQIGEDVIIKEKSSAGTNHIVVQERKPSVCESDIDLSENKQENSDEETTLVTWNAYVKFLKESNNIKLGIVVLMCIITTQLLTIILTNYIGYWAQKHNEEYSRISSSSEAASSFTFNNSPYITFCFTLLCLIMTTSFLSGYLIIVFLVKTASVMHNRMVHRITRTFIHFFDTTPVGRVLNRFSNDISIIDRGTWAILLDLCSGTISLTSLTIYLCILNVYILIPAAFSVLLFYKITMFYMFPSLELRRTELVSRSPMYSEVSSTLNGLLIIRVYNQGERFVKNFVKLIYNNTKASLTNLRANRLFGLFLDSVSFTFVIISIFMFIYIAYQTELESGAFGVAVYYLIVIFTSCVWTTRQILTLKLNMQSVQRIQEYCELPEEPPYEMPTNDAKLKKSGCPWPSLGEIVFQNVSLKYKSTNQLALNNLNFTINAGSKIAIVGRTGAGKSSIIQALFRIVEIHDTSHPFIKIDGVDIKTIGLELLRSSLSILPQTPVIFTGTVRRNLDPFDDHTEPELWNALEQVSLKIYVESLENKLEADISLSTSVFSTGQKQLICLARVVLKKSKIVVLDEATANVDLDTDRFIQEKIKEVFKGCTARS